MNITQYLEEDVFNYLVKLKVTGVLKKLYLSQFIKRPIDLIEYGKDLFYNNCYDYNEDVEGCVNFDLIKTEGFNMEDYIDFKKIALGHLAMLNPKPIENGLQLNLNEIKFKNLFFLGLSDKPIFIEKKNLLSTIKSLASGQPPLLSLSLETWFNKNDFELMLPIIQASYEKDANIKKLNKKLLRIVLPIYNKVKFT